MLLRNKKTGEIVDIVLTARDGYLLDRVVETSSGKDITLKVLNNEWEDYEEPKEFWFIDYDGGVIPFNRNKETATDRLMKEIGNYFETREEAEKAVERLRAWKRLKDKGFRLNPVVDTFFCLDIFMKGESYEAIKDDLKILFLGGEE